MGSFSMGCAASQPSDQEDGPIKQITNKNFSKIINDQYVCVWFFARWCGPCKAVKPVIERIADDFNDRVKFFQFGVKTKEIRGNNECTIRRYIEDFVQS